MYSCSGSVLFFFFLLVCRPGYLAIIKLTIAVAVEHQRKYSIHLSCMHRGCGILDFMVGFRFPQPQHIFNTLLSSVIFLSPNAYF